MCLNRIDTQFDPPDPTVRRAWKIVSEHPNGSLWPPFYTSGGPYRNEWQTATRREAEAYHGDPYLTGFHAFADEEQAKWALDYLNYNNTRKIVPVEVRGVMYEGTDATDTDEEYRGQHLRTLVAREIRLVEVA